MEAMDKNEIYEALKNDGAKLKAINFYTIEQLQEIYNDRFEPATNSNSENDEDRATEDHSDHHHEEPNGDKLNDGEGEYNYDRATEEKQDAEDAEIEIRTLVFDRGGWSNELKSSYAPGIYRPASVEEFLILKEYAKEIL